jgi:4-hydroxy-3-methylbut-2-enyl diphosphate reductase
VIVTVDPHAGFCWGVVRTIDIAEEQLAETKSLYSLGPIIHNPMEIERLKEKGLHTVTHNELEKLRGETVLIRAHGEPPSTYEAARRNGITIVDATCPVVTKVQERIKKFYDQGYQIVVFGKREHAEVIGLVGQTNNEAVVVASVEEALAVDVTRKTVLFSQTTMDKETFAKIAEALRTRVKEFVVGTFEETAVDFHAKDTICGQVSGRDKKLREFARRNDVMVFVAGKNSSNGKVLFHICREANERTYFVEHPRDLETQWFADAETVGISGATSTPQWLMEAVKEAVDRLTRNEEKKERNTSHVITNSQQSNKGQAFSPRLHESVPHDDGGTQTGGRGR